MMMSPEPLHPQTPRPTMAKSTTRSPHPSILADGLVLAGLAAVALLLFWSLYSLFSPTLPTTTQHPSFVPTTTHNASACADDQLQRRYHDPSSPTFYDDPTLTYTIGTHITNWDEKRRDWLRLHPDFAAGAKDRILMVTGSQPGPCRNPIGDHLLLRFFKNKVDYCRLHGIPIFYNTVLLEPRMFTYWAKYPALRAAMVAHPEAEWLWWVDSDAALTDMDFELPLHRYRDHNLVVHGWPRLVYENRSWTSLNAGVFLIRNCQWALDFMEVWARFGPQSPDYEKWGKILKSELKDKVFPESDDQSALVYLLLKHKDKWGDKIYLENEFYFEGYWVEIVGRLEEIAERYRAMERRAAGLQRRRAEAVAGAYGRMQEERLAEEGWRAGLNGWRRPFITHFTGCQPCSGDHNKGYSGENCFEGMERVLNFADDQVLRAYGFRHTGLRNTSGVRPLGFDFPARHGD